MRVQDPSGGKIPHDVVVAELECPKCKKGLKHWISLSFSPTTSPRTIQKGVKLLVRKSGDEDVAETHNHGSYTATSLCKHCKMLVTSIGEIRGGFVESLRQDACTCASAVSPVEDGDSAMAVESRIRRKVAEVLLEMIGE